MRLHDYWRSSAAYRVRIGLNLKGLPYRQTAHDLRVNAHKAPAYEALNPQGLVPALETGGGTLVQSLAMLEWLEESYPAPALLPTTSAQDRAVVRAMALIVASDIHPLNNLRVLKALRERFGADEAAVQDWIGGWIQQGFAGLEPMIARHGGLLAFGDQPTIADCCLVPQVYSARRFKVDLTAFPRLVAAADAASALPAIAAAHPDLQPDADPR
jgi:maleylpyruvate isomerase